MTTSSTEISGTIRLLGPRAITLCTAARAMTSCLRTEEILVEISMFGNLGADTFDFTSPNPSGSSTADGRSHRGLLGCTE